MHSSHVDVGCAAMEVLATVINVRAEVADLSQEALCKRIVLSPSRIQAMVSLVQEHLLRGTGALLLAQLLHSMCNILCSPQSDTTEPETFRVALTAMGGLGPVFFRMFNHPCVVVPRCAGLLMQAIAEEADAPLVTHLQDVALAEGALLEQLHTAIFGEVRTSREYESRSFNDWILTATAYHEPVGRERLVSMIWLRRDG